MLHSGSALQQRAQPSQQTHVSNLVLVATTRYMSLTTLKLVMAFDSLTVQQTGMRNHLVPERLLHYGEFSQFTYRLLWPLKVKEIKC